MNVSGVVVGRRWWLVVVGSAIGLWLAVGLWMVGMGSVVSAQALAVQSVQADPPTIAAEGGETVVTVEAAGELIGGTTVSLTTSLGVFGAPSGPNRVLLTLMDAGGGSYVASARLFGDGRQGTATVTATVGESSRSVRVGMAGEVVSVSFVGLEDGALLRADSASRVVVVARDSDGSVVPGAVVRLATTVGEFRVGDVVGSRVDLVSDAAGEVAATLSAVAGGVRLTASTGGVSASVDVTLVGPSVALTLTSLRDGVNVGDVPFGASAGSLVAQVLDDGGRGVPGVRVRFETDVDGAVVVHETSTESAVTDADGRARGHLSVVGVAAPGVVMVTAMSGGLSARVEVRVVGPPASIGVRSSAVEDGVYEVSATVRSALGFLAPTGFTVGWEVTALAEGSEVSFSEEGSEVRDGVASVVVTVVGEDVSSGRVRAFLVESEPVVESLLVPLTAPPFVGLALNTGLNVVQWTGPLSLVGSALEPIIGVVVSAWRLDPGLGWVGFFPGTPFGEDFLFAPGENLYVFLSAPAALANVEAAPPPPLTPSQPGGSVDDVVEPE